MRSFIGISIGLAAVLWTSLAAADTVLPESMRYYAEANENDVERNCLMLLKLAHPATPEYVTLTAIFTVKRRDIPTLALRLEVGDVASDEGKPPENRAANLKSAMFRADYKFDFESAKEGAIMIKAGLASKDNSLAKYVKPFIAGEYILTFARDDRPAMRTYAVFREPPNDVKSALSRCAKPKR